MHRHRARAVDRIAFTVLVSSSFFPAVSACSLSALTTTCSASERVIIGVIAAGVVLLIIGGVCLRRRLQRRAVRLPRGSYAGMRVRSSNPPKPYGAPGPSDYSTCYPATPPTLLPAYIPQYPPRGYDTRHNHSRTQSNARIIPEPTTPLSSASMRIPSGIVPRPISSYDTTPLPAPSSPPPALPHVTQTNVADRARPSLTSSPRNPSVTIPPTSAPAQRPSVATPGAARPFALAPMRTGTSNNIDEPPPAYTPV